jgi:hypothetical protein
MRLRWSFRLIVAGTRLDYTLCRIHFSHRRQPRNSIVSRKQSTDGSTGSRSLPSVLENGARKSRACPAARPPRCPSTGPPRRRRPASSVAGSPSRTETPVLSYSWRHARTDRRGNIASDSVVEPRVGGVCRFISRAEGRDCSGPSGHGVLPKPISPEGSARRHGRHDIQPHRRETHGRGARQFDAGPRTIRPG